MTAVGFVGTIERCGAHTTRREFSAMTQPDRYDDTSGDAERFERKQLARDRDCGLRANDLTESDARELIVDLLKEDIVVAVPTERMLVHEPTDAVFEDVVQLAAFHRGWTAGRDYAGGAGCSRHLCAVRSVTLALRPASAKQSRGDETGTSPIRSAWTARSASTQTRPMHIDSRATVVATSST